jgi:hypothetical protein
MGIHKAKMITSGLYVYRGFLITKGYGFSRWQILLGDIHGWLTAANTLRQAKSRIDHWYDARQTGERIPPQCAAAVDKILGA